MLRAEGVVAGYGGTVVLRGVDLVVPDATVVALLGPNGAGKTTLLRVLSGLLRPSAGAVFVDGEDVTALASHELVRRGVCHVPEGRGIFRSLTVAENITLQAQPGHEAEAVERATIAFPVLGTRLAQVAGTMSGGEQQMLALARAYVRRPALVLLDEVSMGLAPVVVDQIFDFLRLLASEGTALLLVEQYVSRALDVSKLAYVLTRGQVSFCGEPSELDAATLSDHYLGVST